MVHVYLSSILSHFTISIVVCCLKLKMLVLYYRVNSNLIDDECLMNDWERVK